MTLSRLITEAEAILFDFDGVIADSEPLYRKSWNTVLADYGHVIPENIYWKHWSFLGEGLDGEIIRTGIKIPDPQRAKSSQAAIYRSYCLSGLVPLFPHAAETLSIFMKHKTCAIASNTQSTLVTRICQGSGCPLPRVIGGEGLRPKPAPDIFQKAAEMLDVPPSRCLVFEDAMKGISAGTAAGMPVVLVRNRYNRDLDGRGAALEVNGMADLLKRLEEI